MTYKLLRHKDFTAEWEKLTVAIRDQFKKKLAKVIEQPHIPKNMLRGDLAGCYKIKLLKAGMKIIHPFNIMVVIRSRLVMQFALHYS